MFHWNRSTEECKREKQQGEKQLLYTTLQKTKETLQQAYASFDTLTDFDLIDSCIFEIKALSARYDYLLRKIKKLEI